MDSDHPRPQVLEAASVSVLALRAIVSEQQQGFLRLWPGLSLSLEVLSLALDSSPTAERVHLLEH